MKPPLTQRKWFYPLVYFLLVVIAFLPLYTAVPYDPRNTQAVILEILQRATAPYAAWGWVFHVLTLAVVGLAVWKPQVGGRAVAAYFGLNYLVIAATQTRAETPTYGYAVHTGALVAEVRWACSGCGWPGKAGCISRLRMPRAGAGCCCRSPCSSSGHRLAWRAAALCPISTHCCCSPHPITAWPTAS